MSDVRTEAAESIRGDLAPWVHPNELASVVGDVLSGLEDAGFALYRPDDCMTMEIAADTQFPPFPESTRAVRGDQIVIRKGTSRVARTGNAATYRLVPVEDKP